MENTTLNDLTINGTKLNVYQGEPDYLKKANEKRKNHINIENKNKGAKMDRHIMLYNLAKISKLKMLEK